MNNPLANIPLELRAYPQWVVSNDPIHKIPLDPKTGKLASVSNPDTWGTFEQALICRCKFIGFVLTTNDPFCIIDLDDKEETPATEEEKERFKAIISTFNSYTEISQSGRGVHIVCKGKVESGKKRDHVEIYSQLRYMIFTGNVLVNGPIEDRQNLIDPMYASMQGNRSKTTLAWLDPDTTDSEILRMASGAVNGSGEKFRKLWEMPCHKEQSENDFALLSLLSFYSRSDEQVIRLFRQSALGQRKKAMRDDYMTMSLEKIRASFPKPPEIDFSKIDFTRKEYKATQELDWPPGLMGEVAKYIYETSNRPVKEISIAAALAFLTGITARTYNVRGMGLNQYIIILAGTGRGKEDSRKGIDRLFTACKMQTMALGAVSFVDDFIGPGRFASGEGLMKTLTEKPCILSVIGEFGSKLSEMTSKNISPNLKSLSDNLLDLYNKSGANDFYRGSAYSQSEKNIKEIKSPNLTILGEGATGSFYESLELRNIASGLIPRFLIFEYHGIRVADSEIDPWEPPANLTAKLVLLLQTAYMSGRNESVCNVPRDHEANAYFKQYGLDCDANVNDSGGGVIEELWSRCAMKALKIAAVLAASDNPVNPVINIAYAKYAINLVNILTKGVLDKFSTGEIGEGDHRQEHDFLKSFGAYEKLTPKKRRDGYNVSKPLSVYDEVVPYNYLKSHLKLRASFKNDRRGAFAAIDGMIARLIRDGVIQEVPAEQAATKFETKSALYAKGREWV